MRLLVCGGRDFSDESLLLSTLDAIDAEYEVKLLIHGAARGADTLADRWAADLKIPVLKFPALWDKHGRSAGHIRNTQMLNEGKPTYVVAFKGGKGTANMVRQAREFGILVREIS